jgi:hypothetical protein
MRVCMLKQYLLLNNFANTNDDPHYSTTTAVTVTVAIAVTMAVSYKQYVLQCAALP